MRGSWLVCAALVAAAGCGRQILLQPPDGADAAAAGATGGAAGTAGTGSFETATVDITQAPSGFAMSCDVDAVVANVFFDNPCHVGHSFNGGVGEVGPHEVECTLNVPGHPVAWSFLLDMPPHQNPVTIFPKVPAASPVVVAGLQASVAKTEGSLTFSRVDPSNLAFIAFFRGTVTWTDSSGRTFTCAVAAPLWGAPGGFT
jgi:hypothetical protein